VALYCTDKSKHNLEIEREIKSNLNLQGFSVNLIGSEYLIISAEKLCLLRCQRSSSLLLSLDGFLGDGLLGDFLDNLLGGGLLDDLLGGDLLDDLLHGLLGGGGLLGDDFLGGGGFLGNGYKGKNISKLSLNLTRS
jgi:hypothetical protein